MFPWSIVQTSKETKAIAPIKRNAIANFCSSLMSPHHFNLNCFNAGDSSATTSPPQQYSQLYSTLVQYPNPLLIPSVRTKALHISQYHGQKETNCTPFAYICSSLFPLYLFSFPFQFFQINTCYIYKYHQTPFHSTPQVPPPLQIMPRKGSKRVCFTPDIGEKPTVALRYGFDANSTGRRSHKQPSRSFPSPPVRLFRYVRVNVAKALGLLRKKRPSAECLNATAPPQRFVPPRDSHHSETLEDCIEFINSSYRKSI